MTYSAQTVRLLTFVAVAGAMGGCGSSRDAAATTADVAALRSPASQKAREATGLSHLPRPEHVDALTRSLAAHYPRELIGVRPSTSVLVDVTLDANGIVNDVAVPSQPSAPGTSIALMYPEGTREVKPVYDPAFGPAAVAALKEVRFLPALRDGRAVPFTIRMSVEFTSPAD